METLDTKVEVLIREFQRVVACPEPYPETGHNNPWPSIIAGPNFGHFVSRKVIEDIDAIADLLWPSEAALHSRITRAEWRRLVNSEAARALDRIGPNGDPADGAETLLKDLRSLGGRCTERYGRCEFAFGCTLFDNNGIRPFSIGPVRFEARSDWIARKTSDGHVSKAIRKRVERAWSGKPKRKLQPLTGNQWDGGILDAIGDFPFVCSVDTNGFSSEMGHRKALTAARLALAAIAMVFRTPSRKLDGMNLLHDRRFESQVSLTFWPGGHFGPRISRSGLPDWPPVEADDWERTLADFNTHFLTVGKVLASLVDSAGDAKRPALMNALAHALLWFHEGCREPLDVIAVAKLAFALDALSGGGKSSGIRKLVSARLGKNENEGLRVDGVTIEQAVDLIYSRGRSRTIHGTSEELGHDWAEAKALAEALARALLLACFDLAASKPITKPSELWQ